MRALATRTRRALRRGRTPAGAALRRAAALPGAARAPLARLTGGTAAAARQLQVPRAAVVSVAGAATVSISLVVAAAAWPSPTAIWPQWIGSPTVAPAPTAEPSPSHQPLRGLAARPQRSPTNPAVPPEGAPERDDEFVTWGVVDLHTGTVSGSDNLAETSTTASMIKVWLVADYLRIHGGADEEKLEDFSYIVRDSNNSLSQKLFEELGREESIHRLIDICGLTDSRAAPGYWSTTRLSGRDTARMGACIADGRATGDPGWTNWMLNEMRHVRGVGDFGVRDALSEPARSSVAIKNGWVIRSEVNEWHVNCLAIGDGWSMGVLARYPADKGYAEHGHMRGAEICRSLATEHLPLP